MNRVLSGAIVLLTFAGITQAQPGTVLSHQKISDTDGGFTGLMNDGGWFGNSVAYLGDLDGDGVGDAAVGAFSDADGGTARGAVWILFLNADGTVDSHQKISSIAGGGPPLSNNDRFGTSVASLGDLDGAGPSVLALAVTARGDDDGGANRGALWILFLRADGTVHSYQKTSSTTGGGLALDDGDRFGTAADALGDLDGDGVVDLAVGARDDDDGGTDRGAVWILFLNSDGTVKAYQKISDTEGGFIGALDDGDQFGVAVAALGDLDGMGSSVLALAVGARRDDDGGFDRGAVWILFLNVDGTVQSHQKISSTAGGGPPLDDSDHFGGSAASLGDQDGDGVVDLAVGAALDDDGGFNCGAVWILFLNADGTVHGYRKISETEGDFTGELDDSDAFGRSVTLLGDLDGDGRDELAVGAYKDDDGGFDRGAVWVLFLGGPCPGDTDDDGIVDVNDLLNVILDWATDGSANGGDVTGLLPGSSPDGNVDVNDLLAVIMGWGACRATNADSLWTW
jgi:hypothetical protein